MSAVYALCRHTFMVYIVYALNSDKAEYLIITF